MRIVTIAVVVVALAYLVQLPTPLRLHNDTIVLVSMGESAAHGGGFLHHGRPSHYPQGYPAIVALLLKLGAFRVWTAVALNFAFLALGLWSGTGLQACREHRGLIALLMLLSFVTLKHATIPLTDLVFFGVAMLCLWMLERGRFWEAFVLVLAAIALRRNGIALVPPLAWVLWQRRRILILPALAAAALTIRLTSTLQDFHDTVAGHTLLSSALQILGFRAMEFGEIAANMPSIALPAPGQTILPWIGVAVLALIAAGMRARAKHFGSTEIFFLSYAAILFVWPYYDPRFWLPVLPLVFGFAARTLDRMLPKEVSVAYLTLYCLIGAAVLAQSIRITFAGPGFPDAYGNAQFRPTYCAFYRSCAADPKEIDADGLRLLQTYR